jgi:hypothetical protein
VGRPGTIYCLEVRHPITGRHARNGYVGKTRQLAANRVSQHLTYQPWAGDITGYRVLWSSRRCTGLRLWWEEVWRIVLFLPLYNYRWNRWNPRRIPVYDRRPSVVRRHRASR